MTSLSRYLTGDFNRILKVSNDRNGITTINPSIVDFKRILKEGCVGGLLGTIAELNFKEY